MSTVPMQDSLSQHLIMRSTYTGARISGCKEDLTLLERDVYEELLIRV